MRMSMIAGNWKMNTTVGEAVDLVKAMRNSLDQVDNVEKVLCPPFVSLTTVKELIKGSSIKLGAQNVHFVEKGAYTGEVSPLMLAGLCEYVIIGHSERRQYFHETGEVVNKKIAAALKVGLKPILCVGERLEENEAGRTEAVVTEQLRSSLAGISSADALVVAQLNRRGERHGERDGERIALGNLYLWRGEGLGVAEGLARLFPQPCRRLGKGARCSRLNDIE